MNPLIPQRIRIIIINAIKVAGVASLPLLFLLYNLPLRNGIIRSLIIASVFFSWTFFLYFSSRFKPLFFTLLMIPVFSAASLFFPSNFSSSDILRTEYASALREYQDVKYYWGGENKNGIDCSGLIRQGLIHTYFKIGLTNLNPYLIREGLDLWWHDSTAKQLLLEYRGKTRQGKLYASINEIPSSEIKPGDFAVTESGVHVLGYLGENQWIEADPGAMKVLLVQVPEKFNSWFNQPVYVVRWKQLL